MSTLTALRTMSSRSGLSQITVASRVLNQKPNIWVEINQEVAKYKPINLGQGFPDVLPTDHVLKSLGNIALSTANPLLHQYTRSMGHPRLVNILAKLYTPFTRCGSHQYLNCGNLATDSFAPDRSIDPMSEVMVSIGAYGALSAAVSALVNPGDEVIVMDPSFDCYTPMVQMAGGVPVYLPLKPCKSTNLSDLDSDAWKIDPAELESKITKNTKAIVLNTPHNPLGKVFDEEELRMLADTCIRHNLVCISDEVYEWLVYPPKRHLKIASLPGMWSRTLTVGSAGKTFSVTGWKLGWTVGPSNLIQAMQLHQQNTVYTCPTPIQEAVATSLEIELPLLSTEKSYFREMCKEVEHKGRDMVKQLNRLGMQAVQPSGGYFMFADVSKLPVPESELDRDPALCYDQKFNQWMMRTKGLCGIPMSIFYSKENRHLGSNYIRFCFFKSDSVLKNVYEIFEHW